MQLTLKEFELLRTLLENDGMVLTRDKLLTKIWGYDLTGRPARWMSTCAPCGRNWGSWAP